MLDEPLPTLESIHLAGSPRAMGEAFGEACRQATHELYETRLAAAIAYARLHRRRLEGEPILDLARQCLPITLAYDPIGYEEFLGIARGADLTPEQLFVTQGLTDLRDILAFDEPTAVAGEPDREGCSAFVVAGDRGSEGRMIVGQTWDLATSNMPYVRLVHRRPDNAPDTISLTLTGCLTLIGLNSEGLAAGNTNLHTRDARPGLQYLSILHRVMRCRTIDEAEPCVARAPRSAAHYYYLADASERAVGLECSATRCERFPVDRGLFVHCNHALSPAIHALEVAHVQDSTTHRQRRLTELLESHDEPIHIDHARDALCDNDGGELGICRYCTGPDDVSTNAAVIMRPATGELHACRAQPDRGVWRTCRVGEN
ncbi:MAG: C45 family peptidase [Phycisphaeraceae bacterium]